MRLEREREDNGSNIWTEKHLQHLQHHNITTFTVCRRCSLMDGASPRSFIHRSAVINHIQRRLEKVLHSQREKRWTEGLLEEPWSHSAEENLPRWREEPPAEAPTLEDPQLLGLDRKGKWQMETLTLGSSCSRACRCQRLHSAREQDRGIITASSLSSYTLTTSSV